MRFLSVIDFEMKEDELVQSGVRRQIALGLATHEECSTRESLFLAINSNGAITVELTLNLIHASGWREVSLIIFLCPMRACADGSVIRQRHIPAAHDAIATGLPLQQLHHRAFATEARSHHRTTASHRLQVAHHLRSMNVAF